MTAIELVVASVVLLVALLALASTMGSSATLRALTRENGIATDAAGNLLEELRDTPFDEIFARYNALDGDDPEGPGTAPGHRFAVPGLEPLPGAVDGMVAEIRFPTMEVPPSPVALPGVPVAAPIQLREDVVDERLGMPRDLNGDLVIDGLDHADDYFLLPVVVDIRWRGRTGNRRHRVFSMLCELPKP